MDQPELIALLQQEVKSLSNYLEQDDYANACADASRETGWAFPVTDDFRVHWMKERAKRALFFYLWSESAHKFRVEQIALNQRFEHYAEIIKTMDGAFEAVQEQRPEHFTATESYKMFGTVAGTGLMHDSLGRDITDYSRFNSGE